MIALHSKPEYSEDTYNKMLKLSVLIVCIFVADTFSQIQPGVPRRARRDIGSPEANSLSADEDKSSIPVADDLTLPNTEVPSENVDSKDSNASTGELGTIHGFGPHHRVTR